VRLRLDLDQPWDHVAAALAPVLGPFLLSLGLRLGLRSNVPAANEEPHLCGAVNPRVGVAPPPATAHGSVAGQRQVK
jgi:hypothetical protein